MIDLRQRVLQWAELKRRHNAGETLSEEDQAILEEGIPAREYREQILNMIRHERRTAAPSEKVKTSTKQREAQIIPLADFLTKEHGE